MGDRNAMDRLHAVRQGAHSTGQAVPPRSHALAASIMREASFRASIKDLRKRAKSLEKEENTGFTTFTAGIRSGWRAEIMQPKFRQAVLAELVATAVFVAVGTAAVLDGERPDLPNPSPSDTAMGYDRRLLISFVFGFMICVLVFSTGGISGGNLNPAVSLSLAITRKISILRCGAYVVAQCLGAATGSAFIYSLQPSRYSLLNGASNSVNFADPFVSTWTALGGEALGTALLVFTVSSAADVGREKNNKFVGALTPLIIGLSVLVAHLFLIPIDGCSINPARSFGSALVSGTWGGHWIFWLGPLVGGPLAAVVYEYVFRDAEALAAEEAEAGERAAAAMASSRSLGGEGQGGPGSGGQHDPTGMMGDGDESARSGLSANGAMVPGGRVGGGYDYEGRGGQQALLPQAQRRAAVAHLRLGLPMDQHAPGGYGGGGSDEAGSTTGSLDAYDLGGGGSDYGGDPGRSPLHRGMSGAGPYPPGGSSLARGPPGGFYIEGGAYNNGGGNGGRYAGGVGGFGRGGAVPVGVTNPLQGMASSGSERTLNVAFGGGMVGSATSRPGGVTGDRYQHLPPGRLAQHPIMAIGGSQRMQGGGSAAPSANASPAMHGAPGPGAQGQYGEGAGNTQQQQQQSSSQSLSVLRGGSASGGAAGAEASGAGGLPPSLQSQQASLQAQVDQLQAALAAQAAAASRQQAALEAQQASAAFLQMRQASAASAAGGGGAGSAGSSPVAPASPGSDAPTPGAAQHPSSGVIGMSGAVGSRLMSLVKGVGASSSPFSGAKGPQGQQQQGQGGAAGSGGMIDEGAGAGTMGGDNGPVVYSPMVRVRSRGPSEIGSQGAQGLPHSPAAPLTLLPQAGSGLYGGTGGGGHAPLTAQYSAASAAGSIEGSVIDAPGGTGRSLAAPSSFRGAVGDGQPLLNKFAGSSPHAEGLVGGIADPHTGALPFGAPAGGEGAGGGPTHDWR